jgi:Ran GTPase-activating protein (RanGAP) involved in mRNA processing and transport
MKAILESLVTLPNLLELDMSSNKMGMKTAKALQAYLKGSNSGKLERLILRNAHVDDFEVRSLEVVIMFEYIFSLAFCLFHY